MEFASTFTELGELEEAERMNRLAVEMSENLSENLHVHAESLESWMATLKALDRDDDVIQVGRRFLDQGCDAAFKTVHCQWILVRGLITFGGSLYDTEHYSQAVRIYRRVLVESAALGRLRNNNEIAHAMLIRTLLGQERYSEAHQTMQGFEFSRFRVEQNWTPLLEDIDNLVSEGGSLNKEAEPLLDVLAAGLKAAFGDSTTVWECQKQQAILLAFQGKLSEAALLLEQAIPKATDRFGVTDTFVLKLRLWHVWILMRAEKFRETQKLLLVEFKETETTCSIPSLDLDIEQWCDEAFHFLWDFLYGSGFSEENSSEGTDEAWETKSDESADETHGEDGPENLPGENTCATQGEQRTVTI